MQLALSFQLSHGMCFKPCSIFRTNLVLWMDRRSFYISSIFFLSMNFHGEQFNSHLTSKFAPFKCSDQASLSIWMRQKLLIWCFHVFTVSLCHQIGEAVGGNLKILLCCPFHFKLNVFSCSSFNWRVHAASPGAPPLELYVHRRFQTDSQSFILVFIAWYCSRCHHRIKCIKADSSL